jgi:two-component sensor histidine kinase
MNEREVIRIGRVIGWLPRAGQPAWLRLAFATGIMGAAFLLELAFAYVLGLPGLSILLFAVFICAVVFDHGTGFYAGALAIAAAYHTLASLQYWAPSLPGTIIFALVCVAVALFGEGLRKALERAIAAERTTNLLLRELQHRTHNTLSIIVALLELQARWATNSEAKEALKAAANRVQIQSEAHRHLHLQHVDKVNAAEYLGEVCRLLERTLQGARPITIDCKIESIIIDAQKALALGLITNELVTNSIKYAFRGKQPGRISVTLFRNQEGVVQLSVFDDGAGCPDDAVAGTGTQLIAALIKEHKGTYSRNNRERGCEVTVTMAPKPRNGARA